MRVAKGDRHEDLREAQVRELVDSARSDPSGAIALFGASRSKRPPVLVTGLNAGGKRKFCLCHPDQRIDYR